MLLPEQLPLDCPTPKSPGQPTLPNPKPKAWTQALALRSKQEHPAAKLPAQLPQASTQAPPAGCQTAREVKLQVAAAFPQEFDGCARGLGVRQKQQLGMPCR